MGIIILFVCASIALAFLSGMLCMIMSDSYVYDDSTALWFTLTILGLLLSIGVSTSLIQKYYKKKYEKKEWSSVKYNLKKKVITIEEDNTIALDTVYTFKCK